MTTAQFIDMVAAGEANKAKEALSDMLGARAFEAIDARKVEIAQSLYATQEEQPEVEVQNTEDTPVEEQ